MTSLYTFTKVTAGLKTIYMQDINKCKSTIQQTVSILEVQDFFIPNGDRKK
jgi:hypothetical protein